MMRILFFSLLCTFASCGSYRPENAVKVLDKEQIVLNSYFSDLKTDYVYKSSIEAYGHHFSGLLIIKPLSDGSHRIALTTDFGNKLLDFTISENSFQINYTVDELNRKRLLHTLRDDFRILLKYSHTAQEVWDDDNRLIYRSFYTKNTTNDFYFDKNNEYLRQIINASKRKEKISFVFEANNTIFAKHITIQHYNFPLKIQLVLMP
ncbi:MAG: hypothetical protein Q4G08_06945 [Capnocytophaga sp.]|nr:hypothetical protein [Capnocytophaga sp.]